MQDGYEKFRWLWWALPVVALVFFIYDYVDPDGYLVINYDFCRDETAYFSGLSPNGRVLDLNKDNCDQALSLIHI